MSPLNLLIDLKTTGESTYAALNELITSKYSDLFSYKNSDGTVVPGFVNCVITGNRPIDTMLSQTAPVYCSLDSPDMSYGSLTEL